MEERPRKAFVVGCEGYTHWPAIKHGIEDAKAFGEVLERLCLFSVFVSYDATRNDFLSLEKTMTQNLKEGGDFLFFFSGHGVYNNGYQYLVPVDGDMENKQTWIKLDKLMQPAKEVSGGTPLVQRQVGKLMAADPAPGARLFIILDCCRAEGDGSNETSPELIGLQQPTTPYFIVHACLKASKAKWGEHHGYLTESFLEVIEDPKSVGKDITTIAKKVADKCINKTQFQLPEVHTTITGEFYFRRGNAGASSSADEGNAGASSSAGEGDAGASSSADEGNAGASSSAGEGNAGASSSAGEGNLAGASSSQSLPQGEAQAIEGHNQTGGASPAEQAQETRENDERLQRLMRGAQGVTIVIDGLYIFWEFLFTAMGWSLGMFAAETLFVLSDKAVFIPDLNFGDYVFLVVDFLKFVLGSFAAVSDAQQHKNDLAAMSWIAFFVRLFFLCVYIYLARERVCSVIRRLVCPQEMQESFLDPQLRQHHDVERPSPSEDCPTASQT